MSLNFEELRSATISATLDALKEYLNDTGAAWKTEFQPYASAIAQDALSYAAALAAGEPLAERNLEHVRAQALTLGALAYGQGASKAMASLQAVAVVIAKIVFVAVKAAL